MKHATKPTRAANKKTNTERTAEYVPPVETGRYADDEIRQLRSSVRCIAVQLSEGSGVYLDDVAWALGHIADCLDRLADECHGLQLPKGGAS